MSWGFEWRPYVSVGQRIAQAVKRAAQLAKKEQRKPAPVKLEGRKITTTFWGNSWCDNLTSYSDFANRLPRGSRYVRNGSVVDLVIKRQQIRALVAGSKVYAVTIKIQPLSKAVWSQIRSDCSASIDSLLDLLAGRFSDGVMQRLTRQKDGLFPSPSEIRMSCNCPDWSGCCKHLAAVMYGVGNRLDSQPELLFLLRGVDHQELVSQAVAEGNLEKELGGQGGSLGNADLGEIFGIELDARSPSPAPQAPSSDSKRGRKSPRAAASRTRKSRPKVRTRNPRPSKTLERTRSQS
jgi:uncharacterized Zn finger protein